MSIKRKIAAWVFRMYNLAVWNIEYKKVWLETEHCLDDCEEPHIWCKHPGQGYVKGHPAAVKYYYCQKSIGK